MTEDIVKTLRNVTLFNTLLILWGLGEKDYVAKALLNEDKTNISRFSQKLSLEDEFLLYKKMKYMRYSSDKRFSIRNIYI
jgi:hypothetical protein